MPNGQPHGRVRLRVRYGETDRMGVAYHPHYLVWCELGRTELLRQLGTSYRALEDDGVLLAVVDVGFRYHAPARYDDEIEVRTWLLERRSRSLTFGYRIVRDDARLASAYTVLVATDAAFRPRPLPAGLRAVLDALVDR